MPLTYLPDLRLNAEISGPADGPPLVLLHSLGTSLRVWDDVVALLPRNRILRPDMRGHGASDTPAPPYAMGALIHDVERLMDHHGVKEAVVVGLSIGGLIAQGLATKRMDLVRGMVLSNTAARLGFAGQWAERIATVQERGLGAIADATMERWLGRSWQTSPVLPRLRQMFLETPAEGWTGAAAAIAGTDFYTQTAALTLPTLAIAGSNDGSTPPDLVKETAELIRGSRFALIRGAGHIPMAEKPAEYATILREFLESIGHG